MSTTSQNIIHQQWQSGKNKNCNCIDSLQMMVLKAHVSSLVEKQTKLKAQSQQLMQKIKDDEIVWKELYDKVKEDNNRKTIILKTLASKENQFQLSQMNNNQFQSRKKQSPNQKNQSQIKKNQFQVHKIQSKFRENESQSRKRPILQQNRQALQLNNKLQLSQFASKYQIALAQWKPIGRKIMGNYSQNKQENLRKQYVSNGRKESIEKNKNRQKAFFTEQKQNYKSKKKLEFKTRGNKRCQSQQMNWLQKRNQNNGQIVIRIIDQRY